MNAIEIQTESIGEVVLWGFYATSATNDSIDDRRAECSSQDKTRSERCTACGCAALSGQMRLLSVDKLVSVPVDFFLYDA